MPRGKKPDSSGANRPATPFERLREFGREYQPKLDAAIDREMRRSGPMESGRLVNLNKNAEQYEDILRSMRMHLGSARGKRILHIGSSHGVFVNFLQKLGANAIASDEDRTAINMGKGLGLKRGVVAAAERLPFTEGSFDAIFCENFVLSYYHKIGAIERQIFAQAAGALKEGGYFFVAIHGGPFRAMDIRTLKRENPFGLLDHFDVIDKIGNTFTLRKKADNHS